MGMPEPFTPDWSFWLHVKQPENWQFVSLSLDLEPHEVEWDFMGTLTQGQVEDGETQYEMPMNLGHQYAEFTRRLLLLEMNHANPTDTLLNFINNADAANWRMPKQLTNLLLSNVKRPEKPPAITPMVTRLTPQPAIKTTAEAEVELSPNVVPLITTQLSRMKLAPSDQLINISEVSEMLGIAKSTIYKIVASDQSKLSSPFPMGIKLGKSRLWPLSEVNFYLENLPAAGAIRNSR